MQSKVTKRFFSAALALLILVGMIPVSSLMSASVDIITVSAFDADDVLYGLTYDGDITISLVKDINIQVDESYKWGYDSATDRWLWATVGTGYKRLKLNGHTLAVDDALVDTARYTTETQYNVETGKNEEVDVFIANAFRQNAALICIPVASGLYVDGTEGGKVMMTAKIPDNEQMMDNRIVMQRDVFLVRGGSLTVDGGTYQAGRRKNLYVNKAIKCDSNWFWELNSFYETTYYWGYGEYSINGTAVYAYGGSASVYGGTFIGHGFEINHPDRRNAVLEIVSSARLNFFDGNVQGYSGANCFKVGESANMNFYSGWTKTYAPDRYLWPRGEKRVNADDSYCSAVDIGSGNATCPRSKTGRSEESANGGILYAPEESASVDGLRWENGSASQSTYAIGASKKAKFNFGDLYYNGYAVGNDRHGIDYAFSLSDQQSDGKWQAVTGWISNGTEKTADLLKFSSYMSPGGTYRLSAKATERWSSTHNFTRVFTASGSLSFTTNPLTVNEVSLRINDPTAKEWLAQCDGVTCLTDGYSVESIQWSRGSLTYPADETVVAESGVKYTAKVTLSLNKGVAIASQPSAKVNNSPAAISVNGNKIIITYTFPETANIISSVEFNITPPSEGKTPSFTTDIPAGKHFTKTELRYYESEDGEEYTQMSALTPFVLGRYYKAEIDIAANDGYEFTVNAWGVSVEPDIYATVNGIRCTTEKIYGSAPQEETTVICEFGPLYKDDSIKTVGVVGVDAPYPGKTPDYFVYAAGEGYAVDLDENGDTTLNGVFWSYRKSENTVLMAPDEPFKAGTEYTVNVTLMSTGNSRFATDAGGNPQVSAAVGENAATVGTFGDKPAKDRICVSYTFPWKVVDVSVIEVNDMTLPLAGAHPDYKLSVGNSELYEIKNIQWYQGSYESGTPIFEDDTFAPSDSYAVEIRVSRKMAGQLVISKFASPVTVCFNGVQVDSNSIMANQTDVYIFMNFNTKGGGSGQPHTPGDINGDGAVNNKDLTRLFQYLSDWDVEVNEAALDVNGDGSVNNKDLTRLFQYLSDWDVQIF